MTNIIRLASVLILGAMLTACGKEDGPNGWETLRTVFNNEEISVRVGQKWYREHKTELMDLHRLLLGHPAIKRVTPGQKLEYAPKYGEFDAETEAAYYEARKRAVDLGIITISVYRTEDTPPDDANHIGYVLRTRGLSFTSNSAVRVEYNPDQILLARYKSEAFRKIVPLDISDWYVHQYDKD